MIHEKDFQSNRLSLTKRTISSEGDDYPHGRNLVWWDSKKWTKKVETILGQSFRAQILSGVIINVYRRFGSYALSRSRNWLSVLLLRDHRNKLKTAIPLRVKSHTLAAGHPDFSLFT